MTGLFSRNERLGSFVTALLYIDSKDIQFEDAPDNNHKAVLDILTMTFNENGQMEDPRNLIHTMTLNDAQYQKVMKEGFLFLLEHPVKKPGGYQVRMAIRDTNTQRVGSASQYVEVPDLIKGHLELTSIFLQEATAASSSAVSSTGQSEGHVQSENPLTSAAVRSFPQGAVVAYTFRILNAHTDSVGLPQLDLETRLFRDGKQVNASQPMPLNMKAPLDLDHLDAGGQMILGAGTPPGDYVLQIIATDKLASEKTRMTSQWMDFEVRQ
jgi:hypothetical protein